jgi:hypothetical protein
VGAEERARASLLGGGLCWLRQVEMLFTGNVSD